MIWIVLMALLCSAVPAGAQNPADTSPPLTPPTLGFAYDERFLRNLPLSDSLYPVLENIQPSLITDRFTTGGLFTGQAARVGGFQASWSQTRFLIDDVDLSDPTGSGTPLLFPDLGPWQRIRVMTGLLGSDINATGLAIALEPRDPSATWHYGASGASSHGSLAAAASSLTAPTIARVGGRDRLAWTASGPVTDRLAASLALGWTRASQFDRNQPDAADASIGSLFGSLVRTARSGATLHTVGWVQRARAPHEYRVAFAEPGATTADTSVHAQSTWRSPATRTWPARIFGAVTQRTRTPALSATTGVVERLSDGPIWTVVNAPRGTVRQLTAGARLTGTPQWRGRMHHVAVGADIVNASHRAPASTIRTIGELTDGMPSRVWSFRNPGSDASRGAWTVSGHVTDTLRVSDRLTASAALRVELATGSADGAERGITWTSVLPRARLDWRLRKAGTSVGFLGYTRSATRLALDLLAFGDPNAPWATLYRWDPRFSQPTPGVTSIVARVGPGTGGRADFVGIDPNLRRPVSDELAFGVETRPGEHSRVQLALIGRRETHFMSLVNTGVTVAGYSATFVADPGANTGKPDDDRLIPVYDRSPATFGADQYLLTNPGLKASYSGNVEVSGQYSAQRLTFYGGATASISRGPAASLGYGPLENDQSVVTETYVSPNGDTYRRGRLFNDRAFTIKLSAVYALPWDVTIGAIARYQDGQNFSRVLVFPALAQGPEAVRAFAAGDSRFRFIAALDTRVSKGFTVGGRRIEALLDAYNLTGQQYDVEERAAQAPNDRTPTAYQPTRVLHVGVRVAF